MSEEIVIPVSQRPLPKVLAESADYQELSVAARDAFLGHVRYVQELPFKFHEWLAADAEVEELEAEAYAEYLAAGSPPRGKCSNNKPKSCPVPEPTPAPAPDPSDDNGNTAKNVSALAILYWVISEGSRLFPPRNLVPVP